LGRKMVLERPTKEGESPVSETRFALLAIFLEYLEAR